MSPHFYPVFLRLEHKPVLLVGGGRIAAGKATALMRSGALVTVVSPVASLPIRRWAKAGRLRWTRRGVKSSDLDKKTLVVAATDNPSLNVRLSDWARQRRLWINVVDAPELCDVIAPAVFRRGPVTFAISTGGASPALAKYLRQRLGSTIGPEVGQLATLLRRYRTQMIGLSHREKMAILGKFIQPSFMRFIRRRGVRAAEYSLLNALKSASDA